MSEEKINKLRELDFFLEKVEKAISPSNMRLLKTVADTDKLPRLVWDGNTVILYANHAFLEMTGYGLEDLVGKPFFNADGTSDFITKEHIDPSVEVVIENAKGGVAMTKGITNKWYTKSGREVTIKWYKGFNDYVSGMGSCQCVTMEEK